LLIGRLLACIIQLYQSTGSKTSRQKKIALQSDFIMNIEQLPDCALHLIAAYLPTVSQQFMAMAMTAPSSSWIKSNKNGQLKFSNAGKIISETSTVDVIDFREEYSLHRKLTDDDLGALLVAIDAKNNLKKLFLNMRDQYGGAVRIVEGVRQLLGMV